MIVLSIQHVVNYVLDNFRVRVYKTLQDTVTMKEIVVCEVYTYKGTVERTEFKGRDIDQEV